MSNSLDITSFSKDPIQKKVFAEDALGQVTYSDLLEVYNKLEDYFLDKSISSIVLCFPRNRYKATIVSSLFLLNLPTMVLSHRTKRNDFLKSVENVNANYIITTPLLVNALKQKGLNIEQYDEICLPGTGKFVVCKLSHNGLALNSNISWFINTSGSRNELKTVAFSHCSVSSRAHYETFDYNISSEDSIGNVLTFGHDVGLAQLLSVLYTKAKIVVLNHLEFNNIHKSIQKYGLTGVSSIPEFVRSFLKNETASRQSDLNYFTISGGSLSRRELNLLRSNFPNTRLIKTYGQTETFRSLLKVYECNKELNESLGVECCDSSLKLSSEEDSELFHNGPNQMLGYISKGKINHLIRGDAYIATGDIFKQSLNGEFEMVGRKGRLCKVYGVKVYLDSLTQDLLNIEGLNDVLVTHKVTDDWKSSGLEIFYVSDRNELEMNSLIEENLAILLDVSVRADKIIKCDKLKKTSSGKKNLG